MKSRNIFVRSGCTLSIKLQRLNNFEKYLWKYQVFGSTTNSVSTVSFHPSFFFPPFIHFFFHVLLHCIPPYLFLFLHLPDFLSLCITFYLALSSFHHALPSLRSLHTSTFFFVSFVFFLFLVLLISQHPFPSFSSLNLPLILYPPFIPAFFTFHSIPSRIFYPSLWSFPILCFPENFSFGVIYIGL